MHGIGIAKQNGDDTIVITESGVGLGAVQLIVAESNDRAGRERAAESQAGILLEDILLHGHNVWDAVSSNLEGGTLHNNRAAGANNTALVCRGGGKTNAWQLATAEGEDALGCEGTAITSVSRPSGSRVDLGVLIDAAGAVAGRIGHT